MAGALEVLRPAHDRKALNRSAPSSWAGPGRRARHWHESSAKSSLRRRRLHVIDLGVQVAPEQVRSKPSKTQARHRGFWAFLTTTSRCSGEYQRARKGRSADQVNRLVGGGAPVTRRDRRMPSGPTATPRTPPLPENRQELLPSLKRAARPGLGATSAHVPSFSLKRGDHGGGPAVLHHRQPTLTHWSQDLPRAAARGRLSRTRLTSPNNWPVVRWCSTVNMGVPLSRRGRSHDPGQSIYPCKFDQRWPLCLDCPRCIRSVEAGLKTTTDKALVNSVTAEGRSARGDLATRQAATGRRFIALRGTTSSRFPRTERRLELCAPELSRRDQ